MKKQGAAEHEAHRKISVNRMVQQYNNQKSIIKQALSRVDCRSNQKIVFQEENSDNIDTSSQKKHYKKKKSLFDEDVTEEDFSFSLKRQFEGSEGAKLYSLQSKYKNDPRFEVNEKFLTKEDSDHDREDPASVENEKEYQLKILNQVLCRDKAAERNQKPTVSKMLRFDPAQVNHVNYQLPNVQIIKGSKSMSHNEDQKNEGNPLVAKEVFYKISEDLKESLQQRTEFRFSTLMDSSVDQTNNEIKTEETTYTVQEPNYILEANPFVHDSSDDDDNIHIESQIKSDFNETISNNGNEIKTWNEPFFFRDDDFRFQEGADFIQQLASKKSTEFSNLRRQLKEILKKKLRNNKKKDVSFKKKLGGSKQRKIKRIRKAMKK